MKLLRKLFAPKIEAYDRGYSDGYAKAQRSYGIQITRLQRAQRSTLNAMARSNMKQAKTLDREILEAEKATTLAHEILYDLRELANLARAKDTQRAYQAKKVLNEAGVLTAIDNELDAIEGKGSQLIRRLNKRKKTLHK